MSESHTIVSEDVERRIKQQRERLGDERERLVRFSDQLPAFAEAAERYKGQPPEELYDYMHELDKLKKLYDMLDMRLGSALDEKQLGIGDLQEIATDVKRQQDIVYGCELELNPMYEINGQRAIPVVDDRLDTDKLQASLLDDGRPELGPIQDNGDRPRAPRPQPKLIDMSKEVTRNAPAHAGHVIRSGTEFGL